MPKHAYRTAVLIVLIVLIVLVGALGYAAGTRVSQPAGSAYPPDIDAGSRSRLPVVSRDSLSDLGKSLYDKNIEDARTGRSLAGFQGPNGILLYSPRVADSDLRKNDYLRFDSRIGRRTYEIAVLLTARAWDHQFEWAAHEPAALKAGVEQAIIDIIKFRRPLTGLAPKDAVLIQLGREIFGHRSAQSSTFAEALKLYGAQDLIDVVSVMGTYSSIALILNTLDQQLAPGQKALLPVP